MQPLHFFLGANSEEGFSSLYEQLLGGRFDDLLILKGGAGSGKSNSIAWTAYRLASLFNADNKPVFSSVIVVTDRTVLGKRCIRFISNN